MKKKKKDPIHAHTAQQAILPRFYRERCSPRSPSHLAHRPVTLLCFISTPITVMSKSTAQWGRCRERRDNSERFKQKSQHVKNILFLTTKNSYRATRSAAAGWRAELLRLRSQPPHQRLANPLICWNHSSKNWLIWFFFLYLAKQQLPSINLLVSNLAHLNTLWCPPCVGLHPASCW